MAEQTITLEAGWYSESTSNGTRIIQWQPPTGSRPSISSELSPTGQSRFLGRIIIYADEGSFSAAGRVTVDITGTQTGPLGASNRDLTDAFETSGSLDFTSGGDGLSVELAGYDTTDPYNLDNQATTAFVGAVHDRTGNQAGTLTLRDFVPAAPAFADPTGDAISGTVGTAIPSVTVPVAAGSPAPTYAAVGTLPTGVSFNTGTRVLSFDENSIEPGSGTITIRASNSEGTADWTVAYSFGAATIAPFFADQFGDPIAVLVGETITPVTIPRAAGGTPLPTYSQVGATPSGLTVTLPTTGADGSITGTPDAASSGFITVRATNSEGHADWAVRHSIAAPGMKVAITPSASTVPGGESVTLDGEAYGDLISVDRAGGVRTDVELWLLSQASDGTWILRERGGLSGLAGFSRPLSIATRGGAFFIMDRFGEDIFRITNLDTGAGAVLGTESDSDLDIPQGSTFLGDVYWIIDEQANDLWSWADVVTSPDGGVQNGTVTLTGAPRGMTVRAGSLVVLAVDGRDWQLLRIDDPSTGASTVLATFSSVPSVPISGAPEAVEDYRGSLWLFTSDSELVEITDLDGTPALQHRADFSNADLSDPVGLTEYPVPASYAWASDSGGTFADAAALSTTWDSTGASVGDATLTLTVTDEGGGTATHSVTVSVTGSAPSFADPTGDQIMGSIGAPITPVTVPEAAGAPAPTYAVVGSLPSGLDFDTSTRVISGIPGTTGVGTITIRATNSEGTADWTVDYIITATPVAPSFSDDTGDPISGAVGTAISPVTVPVAAGNPGPTYAVVGSLPNGLQFDTGTRVISGTPGAVASGTIRIRATNSEGSADWTVAYSFGVPPSFADDTGDQINASQGDTIPDVVVPEATGNPTPTYSAVGTLPTGVTFAPATRTLSFDGSAIEIGFGTITIRATNAGGSDDWTVSYVFAAPAVAPSFADPTGDAITGRVGTAIASVTVPVAAGSPAPTYAAVGTLPTGVSFNTGTRVLSFDENNIRAGSGTITIRATNSAGTADWTVSYTFTPAPDPDAIHTVTGVWRDDTDNGWALSGVSVFEPPPTGRQLPSNWVPAGQNRFVRYVNIDSTPDGINFILYLNDTDSGFGTSGGDDLLASIEQVATITLTAGSDSYELPGTIADADPTEPYRFQTPAGLSAFSALISEGEAGTMVIELQLEALVVGGTITGSLSLAPTLIEVTETIDLDLDLGGTITGSLSLSPTLTEVTETIDLGLGLGGTITGSLSLSPTLTEAGEIHNLALSVGGTITGTLNLAPVHGETQNLALALGGSLTGALGLAPTLIEVGETLNLTLPPIGGTITGSLALSPTLTEMGEAINLPLQLGGSLTGTLRLSPTHIPRGTKLLILSVGGSLTGTLRLAPTGSPDPPITDAEAYARGQARALAGVSPRYALEITHPSIPDPVRVVADNIEHTIEGNRYLALAFRAEPPQFQEGQVPRATLEIDNVGRELTQWVETTGGGRGAKMRVMMVHRDTSGSFSHIVWELPALAVGVAELTNERVQVQLVYRSGRSRPGVKMRA